MQRLFILVAVFVLFFVGVSGLWKIAAGESTYTYGGRSLEKIIKNKRVKRSSWEKAPLKNLLTAIGKRIPISSARVEKENDQLERSGMNYTAREYEAKKLVFICLGLFLTGAFYLTGFLFGVALGVLVTLYLYFKVVGDLTDKLQKSDAAVLQELPQFVQAILAGIKTDRNIIHVIERYIPLSGPVLRPEITALTLEMNTGGVEKALLHFDSRMGVPEISRFTTILINIERGIDQGNALEYLTDDMLLLAAENVAKELSLRPAKLKRVLTPCVAFMSLGLIYVLIVNVFTSMRF